MKAWLIEADPQGARLVWRDLPDPVPGPQDLLVRVHAAGLNRADLSRRAGHFELIPTRPVLPVAGLEATGTVLAVGAQVSNFKVGDRVMGMPSGAYAQLTLMHSKLAMNVPPSMSWSQAGATPVALLTAHNALDTVAQLKAGESVLVQGAATAVGIAALQIARELGASMVMGTVGSDQKGRDLAAFGLTTGIHYKSESIADRVLSLTDGRGVDVIVDMVGAKDAADHLKAAAVRCRWVQVGRMGGKDAAVDLDMVSRKRIRLCGVTFRTLELEEFASVVSNADRVMGDAVSSGRFTMPIARTFALDEADRAQEFMRDGNYLGKIVLLS